jgi:hypothetical protein
VRAERAEAPSFWNDLLRGFGISRRRIASFEEPVKNRSRCLKKTLPKAAAG